MSDEQDQEQTNKNDSVKKPVRHGRMIALSLAVIGLTGYFSGKCNIDQTVDDGLKETGSAVSLMFDSTGKGIKEMWYDSPSDMVAELKEAFQHYQGEVRAGEFDSAIRQLEQVIDENKNPEAKKASLTDQVSNTFKSLQSQEEKDKLVAELYTAAEANASDEFKAKQFREAVKVGLDYFDGSGLLDLQNKVNGKLGKEQAYKISLEIISKAPDNERYQAGLQLINALPDENKYELAKSMIALMPESKRPDFVQELANSGVFGVDECSHILYEVLERNNADLVNVVIGVRELQGPKQSVPVKQPVQPAPAVQSVPTGYNGQSAQAQNYSAADQVTN